jgi:RNA polymerase sigma-70 factor (ECF subfamily)
VPANLPRAARRYAPDLTFARCVQERPRADEDIDSDRLVVRFQRGDVRAFDGLYLRYFDRVYAYARVALRDEHEAEDVAQQVFGNVVQALPRYEVRQDSSFRAWLFRITRNVVLRTLERTGRLSPQEPAELDRRLESPVPDAPFSLDWLSDKDLAMLVERLPLSQRQVILLRYVFEFTTDDIARALERTPVAIRMLEHRSMRGLETRLAALRGGSHGVERSAMVMRHRPLAVAMRRRFALRPFGGAPAYI